MPVPERSRLAAALVDLLREKLENGQSTHVPGLGSFRVFHQASRVEQQEDGRLVMKPPRDVVAFSAD